MAVRYSGNIELRIKLVRMRGWNGKMGPFYKVHVRAPRYSGEGILSPREAGIHEGDDLRTSDSYDKVAKAILELASKDPREGKWLEKNAAKEGGLFGKWEILRVQQAPCPLEQELEVRRRGRGR